MCRCAYIYIYIYKHLSVDWIRCSVIVSKLYMYIHIYICMCIYIYKHLSVDWIRCAVRSKYLYHMGCPNELSRLPIWEIEKFDATVSSPGYIKPIT